MSENREPYDITKYNPWHGLPPRPVERIPEVLAAIEKFWRKHPDMRLGQLLMFVTRQTDNYYVEDDRLLRLLIEDREPTTTEQPPAPDEETMMPPTGILSGLTINGKPVLPDVPVHVKAGDRVVLNGVTRKVEVLPPIEEPQPSTPKPGGGGLAAQLRAKAERCENTPVQTVRDYGYAYRRAAGMAEAWEARVRAKLSELKAEAEPEAYSDNDVDDYYRALGVLQAVSEIEEVLGE